MKLKIIGFAVIMLSALASTSAIAAPQRGYDHGRDHAYGHEWHQPRVGVGVGIGVGVYDQPVYGDGYYNVYPTYAYPAGGWGYDHDYHGDYGHDNHGGYHDDGHRGDRGGHGYGGHRR